MATHLLILSGNRNKASSRVRGWAFCDWMQSHGHTCYCATADGLSGALKLLPRLLTSDSVYFQKRYSRWDIMLQRVASSIGKRTVLDLDDTPSRTQHPVTVKHARLMMQRCSAVTVGSSNLESMARMHSSNVYLLPSTVDVSRYEKGKRRSDEEPVLHLGWIGNGNHYARDLLEILLPAIQEVNRPEAFCLTLIGTMKNPRLHAAFGSIRNMQVQLIDQLDWADREAVPNALAHLDVGLYPLLDNEFNQYKCGFKAVEYMAAALPVIASPVGANREIIVDQKTGLLAGTTQEWCDALGRLREDLSLRRAMGSAGQQRAREYFDLSHTSNRLLQILSGTAT